MWLWSTITIAPSTSSWAKIILVKGTGQVTVYIACTQASSCYMILKCGLCTRLYILTNRHTSNSLMSRGHQIHHRPRCSDPHLKIREIQITSSIISKRSGPYILVQPDVWPVYSMHVSASCEKKETVPRYYVVACKYSGASIIVFQGPCNVSTQ